jgi:hypothetical protein
MASPSPIAGEVLLNVSITSRLRQTTAPEAPDKRTTSL